MWWPPGAVICAVLLMLFCVVAGLIMLALGPAARRGDRVRVESFNAYKARMQADEDARADVYRIPAEHDREDRS